MIGENGKNIINRATDHVNYKAARRGVMLVLSSPSGAGKSSLGDLIVKNDPQIALSVSLTTRPKRKGEQDGIDYQFVSEKTFLAKRDDNELLEWARVFDHFYGSPRAWVESRLEAGLDVLFDIDWQGTQQLHEKVRHDLVRVFILPPSIMELKRRLKSRGLDIPEAVMGRMRAAGNEISHWAEYDYVVVNHDLQKTAREIMTILISERLKRERQLGLAEFVRKLQKDI